VYLQTETETEIVNLTMNLPTAQASAYTFAEIEAAARATSEVPLQLSRFDARPRWCAVSLAHPVEFARFRDDARVAFYFNAAAGMQDDDLSIPAEPKQKREMRLREIFGAYVCGDTIPWLEPFTIQAYAEVGAHPVRDMTAAVTACLASIVDDAISSVPAELREPEYVRVEREEADARSKSRKRSGSE
jgi:hypothetical protein